MIFKKIIPALCIIFSLLLTCNIIGTLKATELRNPQTALSHSPHPDVVITGSSHAYRTFIPQMLYDEYGIAAINYAAPNQSIIQSYWALKELFSKYVPELIVLEVYLTNEDNINTFAPRKFDFLSKYKFPMVIDTYNSENHWMMYDRFFSFRTDENALTYEDYAFLLGKDTLSVNKGFSMSTNKTPLAQDHVTKSKKNTHTTNSKTLEYYQKILQLISENNSKLVVCVAPYLYSNAQMEIYYQMEDLASQYHVPFLNYALNMEEIALSLETDFADSSHVNFYGGTKVTKHLGSYLTQNYNLADRRTDKAYSYWENTKYSYIAQEMTETLTSAKTLDDFLLQLQNADNSIAISISIPDTSVLQLTKKQRELLMLLGFTNIDTSDKCYAALRIGKNHILETTDTPICYNDEGISYLISTGKQSSLCIGGNYISKDNMLINIAVSSRTSNTVFAIIGLKSSDKQLIPQIWTP